MMGSANLFEDMGEEDPTLELRGQACNAPGHSGGTMPAVGVVDIDGQTYLACRDCYGGLCDALG